MAGPFCGRSVFGSHLRRRDTVAPSPIASMSLKIAGALFFTALRLWAGCRAFFYLKAWNGRRPNYFLQAHVAPRRLSVLRMISAFSIIFSPFHFFY